MLTLAARRQRGLSLVEIVVVLAIVSMLVMMAAPTFSTWVINSRIRGTAEAMQFGLQFAKAEAVARNTRVRFQLTDTLDNACVASLNGLNWVVNLDPNAAPDQVEGNCGTPANDGAPPFILQTRPCQVRTIEVHASESKGACWARHKVQSLWQGEDYYLQIDSHMRFVQGWDEILIAMLEQCDSPKPVLSTYPLQFTPPNMLMRTNPPETPPRERRPTR